MSKRNEELSKIIAYIIAFAVFAVGVALYILAMKYLPCDFFLRVGDSPVRCL